jgi:hypothetical protein
MTVSNPSPVIINPDSSKVNLRGALLQGYEAARTVRETIGFSASTTKRCTGAQGGRAAVAHDLPARQGQGAPLPASICKENEPLVQPLYENVKRHAST